MAIFGKIEDLKKQLKQKSFQVAFDYLENISNDIFQIKDKECIKEFLDENIFVLKQAYKTKNREDCFFESHRKYIDIQYMVKGSEIMDVSSLDNLDVIQDYDEEKDFTKYSSKKPFSSLLIKDKELAIFYPNDAHQPCIKVDDSTLIYKAVIKIPVDLI
ncbi:YhcH/YjgK/YiaL family protein [Arcobacter sp.]|uniref:YhcH/YjgK/YiaL family protein n=1 Tax=Arcobacter sp. TaxID=1872629 RepID=UPI003D0A7D1D